MEHKSTKNDLYFFLPLKGLFYIAYVCLLSTNEKREQDYKRNMGK